TGRLDRFLKRPWRALRLVRRRGADVVHIHDAELLAVCPVLKLLERPIVIYDVHEDFANLMHRRDWIPRPLRAAVRRMVAGAEGLLARSVDAVVAATGSLADRFAGRPRIALYNLPTRDFLGRVGEGAGPPSTRAVDVVHLGVLSAERLSFLAAALRELSELRPSASMLVIGLAPAQVEALGERVASDRLELRGRVPYDDIPRLLQDCKVGVNVHPFLHPHLQVAVPVKVFEYMAAGCGVVTSWLPELHRLLAPETASLITTLRDEEAGAYGRALAACLDDPARLDEVSPRLREDVRDRYSWESQAGKLVDLYDELLAARSAA
ncbi:MAG: glycosyltransferase family 4 protein, partial [Actinobacteria bacterium]|nr:glycosyltransferase family 4 protein [Actinomycetota bacterium]